MRPYSLIFAALLGGSPTFAQTAPLREVIASIATRDDLGKSRQSFLDAARKDAASPLLRRPATFSELLANPQISVKYDEKPAHQQKLSEEEYHRFALSLGDANLNGELSTRLPRLAAAYVITKDETLLTGIISQLQEMAKWSPLERPGSVSTRRNIAPAPWLGTGWAIRAITDTIEILPQGKLPADLERNLHEQFEQEILNIRTAWQQQELWYTREASAYSNQWVVPMEGLVKASLFNGLEKHRADYEFGVANLLKSLDAQGADGEFAEGVSYAGITLNALLSAAEATARNGDRRLIDHPYFGKFPIWYAHHLQPGKEIINAFDSKVVVLDPALLSRFVADIHSPEALWTIERQKASGFGSTLYGLIAKSDANFPPKEPPLFAAYRYAARINWRSSWDDDTATGFWMRGGHASDAHDHMDRGHISFTKGNRRILIEAGIESYGIPNHTTHFRSVAGHNVLQVGSQQPSELTSDVLAKVGQILKPANRSAPITAERMDTKGGAASVDASACYASTERWVRHVSWDHDALSVRDEVILKSPDIITFRWHVDESPDEKAVIGKDSVNINGIDVHFDADSPVTATVEPMPGFDTRLKATKQHACVVIRSAGPVKSLVLKSRIGTSP